MTKCAASKRLLLCALPFCLLLGCGDGERVAGRRPDVLLLTIDTLRADHLGSYGAPGAISPRLDELAARSVLFERAIAASSATVPSHASIFTSRFVRGHSVGAENGATRLEGIETLAERFRKNGYATAAFVSNAVLKRRTGLDRGFDHYDDELPESEKNRPEAFERVAQDSVERALAWLETPRDEPVFLWVHLQDPHGPYTPPPPWDALSSQSELRVERDLPLLGTHRGRGGIPAYQQLGDERSPRTYASRYAGEIAYMDAWAGRLVDAFEARSAERGAVLLVTADHGESLGENGFFFQHGHGTLLDQAAVPLFFSAPGLPAGRFAGPVSHVDIAPTLLELAGLGELEGSRGLSLAGVGRGERLSPEERVLFCDIGREVTAYGPREAVRVRGVGPETLPTTTFHWQGDRLERAGLASERPVGIEGELAAYRAREVPLVPAHAMEEADVARLRALGYLPPERAAEPGSGVSVVE